MGELSAPKRPDVYRWEEPERNSVRDMPGLFALIAAMRQRLGTHMAIEVPSGVIAPSSLSLGTRGRVESDLGAAALHTHDWPVALVSLGNVRVKTFLDADIAARAKAASALLRQSNYRELHVRLEQCPLPSTMRPLDVIAADWEHSPDASSREYMNSLQYLLAQLGSQMEADSYRLIGDIQTSATVSGHAVDWSECDAMLFREDLLHGRHVESATVRGADELLHAFSQTVWTPQRAA